MSELEASLVKGDVRTASDLATRRLQQNPADVEALLAQTRLLMLRQEYQQASHLIGKAEALGATEAPIWRAILAEATGDPQALSLLERACVAATRQEPHFVLGRALNQRQQFAQALPRLERALALGPDNAVAHFQMAYALMELGQVKRGADHLEKALRLNPLYVPAYIVTSRLLVGNGAPADARKLLEQGIRLMPNDPDLRRELASVPPADA